MPATKHCFVSLVVFLAVWRMPATKHCFVSLVVFLAVWRMPATKHCFVSLVVLLAVWRMPATKHCFVRAKPEVWWTSHCRKHSSFVTCETNYCFIWHTATQEALLHIFTRACVWDTAQVVGMGLSRRTISDLIEQCYMLKNSQHTSTITWSIQPTLISLIKKFYKLQGKV